MDNEEEEKIVFLNINLAKMAMSHNKFQDFMLEEMKIKPEELQTLEQCGGCWSNFTFTPRSVEKINTFLQEMEAEGLIQIPVQYRMCLHKETCTNLKQAYAFLDTLNDSDFEELNIGIR